MRLTPDGARYLRMGAGEREPVPFHLRWLLPWLCRRRAWVWIGATWLGLVALVSGTVVLALQHGLGMPQAALAGALVAGLPSLRFAASAPILVDMPALACAVWAAVAWPGMPWVAAALVVVGACASEKTPVWAALFAGSPWLLVGLAVPLARRLVVKPGGIRADDPLAGTLRHPLATGLRSHAGRWRDPFAMLLPWGACLAALAEPSLALGLVLAVAYAQLFVATDTVRLYQQAAPLVAIVAASQVPEAWIVPLALAHWMNPVMGDGV